MSEADQQNVGNRPGAVFERPAMTREIMISMKDVPVGWAMLMYDLDDAKEDLETLITDMQNDPEFDEECFRVRLGHIYWHLNRAWHRRNVPEELSVEDEAKAGRFPDDLEPI